MAAPDRPVECVVPCKQSAVDKLALLVRPVGGSLHQMVANLIAEAGPSELLKGNVAALFGLVQHMVGADSIFALAQSPTARARLCLTVDPLEGEHVNLFRALHVVFFWLEVSAKD